MHRLERTWYGEDRPPWHLRAGSGLFDSLATMRRLAYRKGWIRTTTLPCPVIVVGNISVGGTGKTPLVLWLADQLQVAGLRPGIISRGYGGSRRGDPLLVTADTDPAISGDEAVLLARRSGLPVAVCKRRAAAGMFLVEQVGVNVVISDDGLQHYALDRNLEICVLDGARRLGNSQLLPAGPLREPAERLRTVDFVVANEGARGNEIPMHLEVQKAVSLANHQTRTLESFAGVPVNAVAGIGHPQRFFDQLRRHHLDVLAHEFPDHHQFVRQDLCFDNDYPLLMTEKDAVKCTHWNLPNAWFVPVKARLPDDFATTIESRLIGLQSKPAN